MSSAGEFEYISWLRGRLPPNERVLLGPGDDAAVIHWQVGDLAVLTTDMLMDGVDFHLGETDAQTIGRKALAVNLSDIAAMAARPVAAVISAALPISGGRLL